MQSDQIHAAVRPGHGLLSILDRRGGGPYDQADIKRAELFADLALAML